MLVSREQTRVVPTWEATSEEERRSFAARWGNCPVCRFLFRPHAGGTTCIAGSALEEESGSSPDSVGACEAICRLVSLWKLAGVMRAVQR